MQLVIDAERFTNTTRAGIDTKLFKCALSTRINYLTRMTTRISRSHATGFLFLELCKGKVHTRVTDNRR